jgi:hypothetical protein
MQYNQLADILHTELEVAIDDIKELDLENTDREDILSG